VGGEDKGACLVKDRQKNTGGTRLTEGGGMGPPS